MADPIQQQLIAARRHQILDAATQMFAQKGYHPTTIKDIAQTAGIADGTIYLYFENKTALLIGIFERLREAIVEDAQHAQPASDLPGFINQFLRYPLKALEGDNFALFRVVVSEMMFDDHLRSLYAQQILAPTLALGEAQLAKWVAQKHVREVDVALTIRALAGLVHGVILAHIFGDSHLAAHQNDLPDFLADLVVNGLAPRQP